MKRKKRTGLVHIYTGNGKGKTTAAFGLAVRAAGAGLTVFIHQFIKGLPYSEHRLFKRIRNVTIEQCGRGCFIRRSPTHKDIECAQKGLQRACDAIYSGAYDVVILDEVNVALHLGLIASSDIEEIIKSKPDSVELIMTGRHCPKSLYRCADLVTEMREVKHPFNEGIMARKGIEY